MRRYSVALAIIIAAAMGWQPVAFAGPWQSDTSITQIIIEGEQSGTRIYLRFGSLVNTEGCTGDATFARIYGNTVKGRSLVSLATAAKLEDKPVLVYLDGCDDWDRPVVAGLWLL
ncbi:MAG TPA: hypothetical protein VNM90_22715 [Haliangium sp.]|nr:hypothetical protein [Haliangium sp.]